MSVTTALNPDGIRDPLALLNTDITYPGWEYEIGDRRSFYVRGFTWFRDHVLSGKLNVTDARFYIPQMKELLDQRPGWLRLPFRWEEPFSARQFIDAASPIRRSMPKFHKAAQIILLCEAITRNLHKKDPTLPNAEDIYRHMCIEPAVSYIHGFDRAVVEAIPASEKALLRQWTGQRSNDVFYDLAAGHTVTHGLAERIHNFFSLRFPETELGDVDFRPAVYWRKGPSYFEFIDLPDADYPEESILRQLP